MSSNSIAPRGTVRVVVDFDRDDFERIEEMAKWYGTSVTAVVERAARLAAMAGAFFTRRR